MQDEKAEGAPSSENAGALADAPVTGEVQPLKDITNDSNTDKNKGAKGEKAEKIQIRPPRERRERGPPADGIPSKTKVMVANLPYDLTEEKVSEL